MGKFHHAREPASVDDQTVIRMNRDTLYSFAVFDLLGGAATVSLPDAGKNFMSMMVVDQDHYVSVVAYGTKPITLTQKSVGTRYALVAVRTLVDPNDPKDLAEVHRLQDAIKVSPKSSGNLELPNWDDAALTDIAAPPSGASRGGLLHSSTAMAPAIGRQRGLACRPDAPDCPKGLLSGIGIVRR